MPAFSKFDGVKELLAEKVIHFSTDVLKVMLVNAPTPIATNAVKADLVEIGTGNGYVAGGKVVVVVSSQQVAGVYRLVVGSLTWGALGGAIGPFRYSVLYDDTVATPVKPLVGWWDVGAQVTLSLGETFTWRVSPTSGLLTLS